MKKKASSHCYLLNGPIESEQLNAFIACDMQAGPGELLINSTGGDLGVGFALYDYIRCYSPAWRATVIGSCLSAAMLPLLACKSRAITPNGSLMMHHGHSSASGIPGNEFQAFARDTAAMAARYRAIMQSRSKAGEKTVRSLMDSGHYLPPDKALALGFVHALKPFRR